MKKCRFCGNILEKHKTAKYCSRKCYDNYRTNNPLPLPKCMNCNKILTDRRNKRCQACYSIILIKNPRTCIRCGKKGPSEKPIRGKTGMCIQCASSKAGKERRIRVTVQCDQCGKIKEIHPNAVKSHNFCNKACYHAWYSLNMKGEKNYNWKGGKGNIYYGPNWVDQRTKAIKRADRKCEVCNKKTKHSPDIHHIIPFLHFDYDQTQNDNYLQANELTNLIALCRSCHMLAESKQIPIQPYLL